MLYKNLPKAVGLRRVTLHKSINPSGAKDTVYLLLVECSHFMDHVGEAANLLPILRARICGYTGIYRCSDSFWQQPSLAGRDSQQGIAYYNENCGSSYNRESSRHFSQQAETFSAQNSTSSNAIKSPTTSLPDKTCTKVGENEGSIPNSPSVGSEESSAGRGFFSSLFNLW